MSTHAVAKRSDSGGSFSFFVSFTCVRRVIVCVAILGDEVGGRTAQPIGDLPARPKDSSSLVLGVIRGLRRYIEVLEDDESSKITMIEIFLQLRPPTSTPAEVLALKGALASWHSSHIHASLNSV